MPDAWTTIKSSNEVHGTSQLVWSNNPGCFERHLQRKHGNPLFPVESHLVTQEQIDEARRRDLQDAQALAEDFKRLHQEVLGLPPAISIHENSILREKIDELLDRAAAIGGDIGDAVEQVLSELRDAVISAWRKAAHGNSEANEAMDAAESFYNQNVKMFRNRFNAQRGRKDSPIRGEDLIPALLSEDLETIRIVIEVIGDNSRAIDLMRASAIKILSDALQNGAVISQLDEKLQALGVSNPAGG